MTREIRIIDATSNIVGSFIMEFCDRTPDQFQMEPENFYRKYNKGVLHKQNIEIIIRSSSPFSLEDMVKKEIHLHQGKDMNQYICYPPRLATMDEAMKMARSWAIMTTFHMLKYADASYFEGFGRWLLAKSDDGESVSPFQEIPLWIAARFNWNIEIKSKTDKIIEKCRKELLNVLKGWYSFLTDWPGIPESVFF